jgi:hypothetical protein
LKIKYIADRDTSISVSPEILISMEFFIIKPMRIRWVGYVARMGEKWNKYRLFLGELEGKRPLGRPRRRWMDNIRMVLGEVGWGGVDWIDLAQVKDRWRVLVNSVTNFRVP